ncbi:cytochrome b/b6 domain-containing protein [Rhodoferax sp.]|uniref:cytochrome b/b6 domain-containing protein n=1 Tax=Rhodoferax sp. TaxID=50421 RepID=UPI0026334C0E|nr:cytochrome b/b6 domain-containing protein [Rhodoferax sp.]MDD3937474.1 cytochrome b/b6 domain-containing protein [Rhodoferax sp.]
MAVLVRVWDAPTRLFHWALSLCVVGLFVTSQVGGTAMDWHFRFGYGVLTLLLFRFVWGLSGGHWSRFSTFVVPPLLIWRYLQGQANPQDCVGHNPLGALSVVTMLALLSLQVASGLISDDEIAAAGPLVRFVSSTWVGNATFYHKEIGKFILLGLVALHLGAIAFYYFRKHDDLVTPMITGDKSVPIQAPSARDGRPERRRAGLIFLACAALVSSLVIGLNG